MSLLARGGGRRSHTPSIQFSLYKFTIFTVYIDDDESSGSEGSAPDSGRARGRGYENCKILLKSKNFVKKVNLFVYALNFFLF